MLKHKTAQLLKYQKAQNPSANNFISF